MTSRFVLWSFLKFLSRNLLSSEDKQSIYFYWGIPMIENIFSSCSIMLFPVNKHWPRIISATTQPRLHISIAPELTLFPLSITSGARYHLDATYSVKISSSCWSRSEKSPTLRTSPKSHIFAVHDSSTRIFDGLISRWMRPQLCRNYRADTIWRAMYFLCKGSRRHSLRVFAKSKFIN